VMFGDPEPMEPQALRVAGEGQGVVQGMPWWAAGAARCLVEDGDRNH